MPPFAESSENPVEQVTITHCIDENIEVAERWRSWFGTKVSGGTQGVNTWLHLVSLLVVRSGPCSPALLLHCQQRSSKGDASKPHITLPLAWEMYASHQKIELGTKEKQGRKRVAVRWKKDHIQAPGHTRREQVIASRPGGNPISNVDEPPCCNWTGVKSSFSEAVLYPHRHGMLKAHGLLLTIPHSRVVWTEVTICVVIGAVALATSPTSSLPQWAALLSH